MLCSGDEICVNCLYVLRIGLTAPAHHEPLRDRGGLIDARLRNHRNAEAACGLCHEGHRHDGDVREVLASGVIVYVEEGLETPRRCQHGDGRLDVHAYVTGVDGQRVGLSRGANPG